MSRRVVVDGSNLATEGRSHPSLAQLNDAVGAFRNEHSSDDVIVVVDASFGYRIDESERKDYEQAELAGTIVSPPAGAIGRGDGFLLQIADRTGATVLSNDSFQEFHGEYGWLFADGRLVGGKPVPGVGWIFTPRTPVRGAEEPDGDAGGEGEAVQGQGEGTRRQAKEKPKRSEGRRAKSKEKATRRRRGDRGSDRRRDRTRTRGKRRRRRGKAPLIRSTSPYRSSRSSRTTLSAARSRDRSTALRRTARSSPSRGRAATCRSPASARPRLRSAKEVLSRGEMRTFVVQALDPPRRGIELALPGLAQIAGEPTRGDRRGRDHRGPSDQGVIATKKTASTKKAAAKKNRRRRRRRRRPSPSRRPRRRRRQSRRCAVKKAARPRRTRQRRPPRRRRRPRRSFA